MGEFFSNLFNVILWVAIGVLVGLLITWLVKLISKKKPNKIVSAFIIIVSIAGALGISTFFKKDNNVIPSPEDRLDDIVVSVSKNWGNTNGGFTFEQIVDSQDDNECPKIDDVVLGMNVYDFGDYVCFWYYESETNIMQNAVFLKTDNGLIYDGLLNYQCEFELVKNFWAYVSFGFYQGYYNLDNFRWTNSGHSVPTYFEEWRRVAVLSGICNDLVVKSDANLSFSKNNFNSSIDGYREALDLTYQYADEFIGVNSKYFTKFGNVELIGASDTAFIKINSFYNYLWNSLETKANNEMSNINANEYMCAPISEDEQVNYPVNEEFKEKYPDIDYYGVYRTNIAVELTYKDLEQSITANDSSKSYIETNKEDEDLKVEDYETKEEFSQVALSLANKNNSDLTNLDLENNPVEITFTAEDFENSIVINSIDKLNTNSTILLPKGKKYTYTIASTKLSFDSYNGSFETTSNKHSLSFNYEYNDNFVVASVGLNPIGTIDESVIDLATNPVKVILSNDKNTYQFVFDDNSKLNTYISQFVEMGDYEYTILSNQLIFASVSGNLAITTTDNIMLFNFALNLNSGELNFTINLTSESSSTSQIKLYATADTVTVVRENLVASDTYNVVVYLYDANGKIVEQRIHLHSNSVTGECFADWTIDSLVNGEHYTAQVRFVNPADSTITYLSDIIEFDYDNTKTYTFTYTASVVE